MDDAISRQAAIDEAKEWIDAVYFEENDKRERKAIECFIGSLKNIPSAQPEQRWIPVSERLPMEFEFVNCTCHSLIDDREDWVVETVYIPQPSDSPYSDWGNIPMLNSGDCEVVAWVHRDIPKPYKAESEGEK